MIIDKPVPLVRRFSPAPRSDDASDEQDILAVLGYLEFKSWPEIDKQYRSVIVAEAGGWQDIRNACPREICREEGRFRILHPHRGH